MTARQDYAKALIVADSLTLARPNDPVAYLMKASILNSRATDFEDILDDAELRQLCNKIKILSEVRIKSSELNRRMMAEAYFSLANAVLFEAMILRRRGEEIKSLFKAMDAGGYFQSAVTADSGWVDAKFGLGVYYYHHSLHAGLLRSIGLIADRRQEGINLVRYAAAYGDFTRLAARVALLWIFIEERRWGESLASAWELSTEFPNSRSIGWALGKIYRQTKQWDKAVQIYQNLLLSIRNENRNNHHNELSCLHSIAQCLYELKRWQNLIAVCEEALGLELERYTQIRKKEDIQRLNQLKKVALKKINENND